MGTKLNVPMSQFSLNFRDIGTKLGHKIGTLGHGDISQREKELCPNVPIGTFEHKRYVPIASQ